MESPTSADFQLRPDRDLTILIPARAGSKRCPGKNTRMLSGKPLFLWTVDAALAANVAHIIVSTDDPVVKAWLGYKHRFSIHDRKPEHATDDAPDFAWVSDLREMIQTPVFAICRPTSPFRTASTIRRAFAQFMSARADSLRAVERVTNGHPGKMWVGDGRYMIPLMSGQREDGTPFHSSPTQSLPTIYKQNACLEMAWTWVIEQTETISGTQIVPFFTHNTEGVNIDTEEDFREAERLALEMATTQIRPENHHGSA